MTENEENLTSLLEDMCDLTIQIQSEINIHLLKDDKMKAKIDERSKEDENKIMKRMNSAIYGFIAAMPLASANYTNLFMQVIAHHSKITGDPTLKNALIRISEKRQNEEIEDE
tara:strand:+ start:599 stop:937 length:339 start_codon:yes stop_codon:yes gene_type:complete